MTTSKKSATPSEEQTLNSITTMMYREVFMNLKAELDTYKRLCIVQMKAFENIMINAEERNVSEIQEFCRQILDGGTAPTSQTLQ